VQYGILCSKLTKKSFARWGAYRTPLPLAEIRGPLSGGKGRKGKEGGRAIPRTKIRVATALGSGDSVNRRLQGLLYAQRDTKEKWPTERSLTTILITIVLPFCRHNLC